eukprot:4498727-Pleurochrysis_carterae.AAC.1
MPRWLPARCPPNVPVALAYALVRAQALVRARLPVCVGARGAYLCVCVHWRTRPSARACASVCTSARVRVCVRVCA